MALHHAQRKQIEKQLEHHRHEKYHVDIVLDEHSFLKNFSVHAEVFRPDITTALFLARFLFWNNGVYYRKTVIDMGAGSGIQGMVAGLHGAQKVVFSDVSVAAVANIRENVDTFQLGRISEIVQGDLFESVHSKVDVIIFNHPFFPAEPIPGVPVSHAMLDAGNLLQRFLQQARGYLRKNGKIFMPFFHLAGTMNSPSVQGKRYGYKVTLRLRMKVGQGLQQGLFSVFELG